MQRTSEKTEKHAEIKSEVIDRAITGDATSLALIYDSYARDIYRYCYSRVGDVADAEDLTAQTFMSAIEALPRYRHQGYFSAWIFQIAHNKIMDFYRKQKRDPVEIPLDAAYSDVALDNIIKGQSYERLSAILKNLTTDERELIRLRYVVELSFVDIALTLGRKEDAVRKSLNRILERLYHQMEVHNV